VGSPRWGPLQATHPLVAIPQQGVIRQQGAIHLQGAIHPLGDTRRHLSPRDTGNRVDTLPSKGLDSQPDILPSKGIRIQDTKDSQGMGVMDTGVMDTAEWVIKGENF